MGTCGNWYILHNSRGNKTTAGAAFSGGHRYRSAAAPVVSGYSHSTRHGGLGANNIRGDDVTAYDPEHFGSVGKCASPTGWPDHRRLEPGAMPQAVV